MPRYRMGSTFYTPSTFPMPMPSVPSIVEQSEDIPVEPLQIPTEPCPIPEECIQILKTLDSEALSKCIRAMRNGTPGNPTASEKGVLRRIANGIGVDDVVALSWSPTYKLYFS
jgi:hypothetical protein